MQPDRVLRKILKKAQSIPTLYRRVPTNLWRASIQMVSLPVMTRLNSRYRQKKKPTDILSFPAPQIFRKTGFLGELVICTPILKQQALEQGHSVQMELEVLVVHGVLHLLGWDHEKGKRQAQAMARWEKRLLGSKSGLIVRTHSGNR